MEERLKQSLQQIVYTLQESEGTLEYSRLVKRLLSRGRDEYYSIDKLLKILKDRKLIEDNTGAFIRLTSIGNEFKGFDQIIDYKKYREDKVENLNIENLELQNKNLMIQNSSFDRQIEIDRLTIENLKLQNNQMKNYIFYSIISFVSGALITNIKDIINYISSFF